MVGFRGSRIARNIRPEQGSKDCDALLNQDSVVAYQNANEASSIYELYKSCIKNYTRLCGAVDATISETATQNGYDRALTLASIRDDLSRFKAWATNIAAHQPERLASSLDARLKGADETRERVLKILDDLEDSLHSACLIVSGEQPNETWQVGAISDSDDEENREPMTGVPMRSELDELLSAIESTNSSLMKLSMVIRNSPLRDDYLKAASRCKLDPRWDIGHLREKHGSAKRSSDWLLERLGKSITRRRQYLIYRKDHHDKLAAEWDEDANDIEGNEPDKTIAETKHTKATTFIATKVVSNKDGSEVGGSFGSKTSYEATVVGEGAEHRLSVPQHPTMAFDGVPFEYGKPFQCRYCYTEQTAKNRGEWKKHVFRDLKPYVCTFKECDLRMFRSRNEWFAHELQNHRREWTCPYCDHVPFSGKAMFSKHVTSVHGAGAGPQLEALILQCEEPVDKISPAACHLCNEWEANLLDSNQEAKRAFLNEGKKLEPYGTLAQFRRHLGRHMEQLALFALPIDEVEEAEDQSDSQSDDNEPTPSVTEQTKDTDSVLEEAFKGQSYPGHPAFVNDPREAMVNAHQNTQAASVQQFVNSSPFQGASPTLPSPVPEGWLAHLDQNSGQYYYIHLPTQATQWEFPKGPTPLNPWASPGFSQQNVSVPAAEAASDFLKANTTSNNNEIQDESKGLQRTMGKKEGGLDEKETEEEEQDSFNSAVPTISQGVNLKDAYQKYKQMKESSVSGKDAIESSASTQLELISSHFRKDMLPLFVQFTARQQMEPEAKDVDFDMLRKAFVKVILQLDAVKVDEDTEDSTKRRALIREVKAVLDGLDAKLREGRRNILRKDGFDEDTGVPPSTPGISSNLQLPNIDDIPLYLASAAPSTPPQSIINGDRVRRERGRPVIIDERPLPRPRVPSIGAVVCERPIRRNAQGSPTRRESKSPSSSDISFNSHSASEIAETEQEAERRREETIRQLDEEIRRRPALPPP